MSYFESFNYYPSLRARPAEVLGYDRLDDACKNDLLPIFTAGAWPKQEGIEESIQRVRAATGGRSFILDVTREPSRMNSSTQSLLEPERNFAAWQKFVAGIPNVVPVLQITPSAKISQVIHQARELEQSGTHRVAFRISGFSEDVDKVTAALSALSKSENGLVIIDAGYIRETFAASLAACVTAINSIRQEVEDAIVAVLATSFPASVVSHIDAGSGGKRGVINLLERVLHAEIGPDAAIYGDHCSVHARTYPAAGGHYVPRIDYPMHDAWAFECRPDANSAGYVDAAKSLITDHPEISRDATWGAERIVAAAAGEIDAMRTPAMWIAARVNMHIAKQFELSRQILGTDEDSLMEDFL
nr:protein beta [uncultured Cupriavidus sp.]